MKINAKQLIELIKGIVKKEVKSYLPRMVKECLAESYIKKIVEESRKDVKIDSIPKPMSNNNMGIYKKSLEDDTKNIKLENASKLMTSDNPLSFIYDDINNTDNSSSKRHDDVSLNYDFSRATQLFKAMNESVLSKKELPVSPEARMKEIEMRRKELDARKF